MIYFVIFIVSLTWPYLVAAFPLRNSKSAATGRGNLYSKIAICSVVIVAGLAVLGFSSSAFAVGLLILWLLPLPSILRRSSLLGKVALANCLLQVLLVYFYLSAPLGGHGQAKPLVTKMKIMQLEMAIEQFQLQYQHLPDSLDELTSCGDDPLCRPILKTEELNDGWASPFVYQLSEDSMNYKIISFGADRKPGGEGLDSDVIARGPK